MRKIGLILVVTLLAIAPGIRAQRHAPTEAQCDADARAWMDEKDLKTQDVNELKLRIEEMIACKDGYPEDPRAYFIAVVMSLGTIQDREENFINRHGLYAQFQDEDKAGKR